VRFSAQDLDLDEAERMLRANIRWRMENNMDDLQSIDFVNEFQTKKLAYLTTDLDGRPGKHSY